MITLYHNDAGKISDINLSVGQDVPTGSVWIDLHNPTDEERDYVSQKLNLSLPTLDNMQSIEASSRLFRGDKTIYLTMDVLTGAQRQEPSLDALLIVALPDHIVTMRRCQPRSIENFAQRIKQDPKLIATSQDGLLALLDAISDRIADIIEALSTGMDDLSRQVFQRGGGKKEDHLQEILRNIGRAGQTAHKIRESISGMNRLVTFLEPALTPHLSADQNSTLKALDRDIISLADHAQFLEQETSFLLDATLGQINIEQNNIIKMMSIVMVAFTPPTFFASLWGMNFHNMPEYALSYGYPMAWCVMIISAIIPLLYFKKKGWL